MCWNTYFIVFLKQPKFAKKWPQKNDNFSHFAKNRFIKKNVLLQPPSWPKIGVFELVLFETKYIDVEQKDFKEKTRQETKKREKIMKKQIVIE